MSNFSKITQVIFIIFVTLVGLIYSSSLLIPFIFALIIWVLIRKLKTILDKIKFIQKYMPSWVKSLIISFFVFYVFIVLSNIISSNITTIMNNYLEYEKNFNIILAQLNNYFGIDLVSFFGGETGSSLGNIITSLLTSLTSILSNVFMILLYILFIFLEETSFTKKLKLVFKSEKRYHEVSKLLIEIENSISNYLGVKTLVSLITGTLSAIALMLIGIDAPIFWALIIFILNYIPTVGSLIGTLFPSVFSLLQYGEFSLFAITLVAVGLIQIIVGNILEPKLVGNSMNISALVAILALSLWGVIWGITGMILSVPITVIMVIIFSKFENTKPIAIMLSAKGNL